MLLSTSKMLGLCQVVLWPVPVQEQQLFAVLKRLFNSSNVIPTPESK